MVETYPEGGGRGGARGGARNNFHHEVPIIVEEVVSLEEKVFFPIDKFPGYNFMGRLLGPKGSNLKELVQSTKTRISILGKGSSKDRSKEEELSKSEEHAHLKEPLHVLVVAKAPKLIAHRRIAHALRELSHFMVPSDDRIPPPGHGGGEELDERPPFERDERRRAPPGGPMRGTGAPPMEELPRRGRDDGYDEERYYEGRRGGAPPPEHREGPPPRYQYAEEEPPRRFPAREPANGGGGGAAYPQKRFKESGPYARNDPYAR